MNLVSDQVAADRLVSVLSNDLNTPAALAILHESFAAGDYKSLKAGASILGLLTNELGSWADENEERPTDEFIARVNQQVRLRSTAKKAKDFKRADEIRQKLAAIGVMLSD